MRDWTLADYRRHVPALVAEIEALRAKLAAVEQERDEACESANHANASADRFRHHAARAEAALAAVRKAIRAERDRFAQATNWKFVAHVKPAVDRIDAAVAAAEQPEPKPQCNCGHDAERHGPESGCIECRCPASEPKREQS